MSKLTTVTSAHNGVTFNVRLVEKGDRYGRNMCLVHDEDRPMVVFFDAGPQIDYDFVGDPEDAKKAGAPCLGQQAAFYYVHTLLENIATTGGVDLRGYVPRWKIDGDALRQAFINLGLWSPPAKPKIVVVWDSNDPDKEPQVWVPPALAELYDAILLDRSQELGGRYPNTDPADIELLEAGVSAAFPDYQQLT